MVDPTWTYTCPCGEKVDVNMMGQHHHRDCEYDPLHPGCCDDANIRRLYFWTPEPGTRCENCGESWLGPLSARLKAMANRLVDDYNIERKARAEIVRMNHRAILREVKT